MLAAGSHRTNQALTSLEVIEAVAVAPTVAAAWSALKGRLGSRWGQDIFYCFGGSRYGNAPTPDLAQLMTLGDEGDDWCRLYFVDPGYRVHDPVRAWVRDAIEPVDWSDLEARPATLPLERRLWRDVKDLGIRGGVTVPLHEPGSGRYGSLSVRTRGDLADFRALVRRELATLQATALYLHGALRARLTVARPRDVDLSRRESEVLLWVANGLVTKAIARRLGLSPRTVDLHIARAMKKLGARTRSEAASLAVLQGRIAP